MAIAWNTTITNVNVAAKRADVTFTRTDSITGDTFTASFPNDSIGTAAERISLCNQAWAAWQVELTKRTNIATVLSNLIASANANMMAREV